MISSGEVSPAGGPRLRQMDINIGAGVMLIGALKAALWVSLSSGPRGEAFILGMLVLSVGFAVVLLLSQLSPRQRGLTLGATLMFLGSLVAAVAGGTLGPAGIALIAAVLIPLILFWQRFSGIVMRGFFDREDPTGRGRIELPDDRPELTEGDPLAALYAPPGRVRDTDSELGIRVPSIPAAPNVTEHTTELLEAGEKRELPSERADTGSRMNRAG
ncbi:MAG TPA: hypothetical protein VNH22_05475 [Blastocatellia bacterium]|nr:hypothetical protein [Blastocatellia bacterium]